MAREVTDAEGITWSCIQAFAGLEASQEKVEAARVDGTRDRYHVVCTPSGGAKSVRVELPKDWGDTLSDEELLRAIHTRLAEEG